MTRKFYKQIFSLGFMNFIKKIVDGQIDDTVHLQFQKFSRGEFKHRAVISAKKMGKGKYSISTTPEFANGLVKDVAKKIGEKRVGVTGAIVSTADLTGELEFTGKKQFQGVKRYLISSEMSGKEIYDLTEKFPKAFFGLSFKTEDIELKIKPKAPKSGKSGSKDKGPKADFCRLKTTDQEFAKNFIFDGPDFKEALINHTIFVDSIVVPEELKKEKDFAVVRERSLRKGRILRQAEIDGVTSEKEIAFEA